LTEQEESMIAALRRRRMAPEGQTFRQMLGNLVHMAAVYFFDHRRHCGSRILGAEAHSFARRD
jgi:hypothetical protein